jgi:hypothetical protein
MPWESRIRVSRRCWWCPLLERAEKLLRLALRANRGEGLRLEWGFLENRPALRLLVNLILWHEGKGDLAEAARLAE